MIGNQLGSFAAGEDIEELASDVFVALWQAGRTLQTEHLRGWLGRVARNQAISFLRKQRLQLVPDEDYLLVDERDAQKLLEAQERSDLLRRSAATCCAGRWPDFPKRTGSCFCAGTTITRLPSRSRRKNI